MAGHQHQGWESGINGLLVLTLWEILISTAYKHREGKNEV